MSKRRATDYLTNPKDGYREVGERDRDTVDPVQAASEEVMAGRKYFPARED
jgi:NUP50 (Nucleoporin 50 kDa)